jgi:hypothetical protein
MRRQLEALEGGNPVEIFADDVAAVTQLGSVTHVLFTARQQATYDGKIYRAVQLRLVVPTEELQRIGRIVTSGRLELQQTGDDENDTLVIH